MKSNNDMPQQAETRYTITRHLGSETDTCALGHELSLFVKPGDVICLHGDLGAGKTTFARGFIQALSAAGSQTDVPSPTFTIVQPYDDGRWPVRHYDLYRISDAEEVEEIGFLEDLESTISIIEWPQRAADLMPENHFEIEFTMEGEGRLATITGKGASAGVIKRLGTVAAFLSKMQHPPVERNVLQGDASSRRYERLRLKDGSTRLLMDMPPDDAAQRSPQAAAYMQAAHLADGLKQVLAVNRGLRDAGFSAPIEHQSDLAAGLLVLEDFGTTPFSSLADHSEALFDAVVDAVELLARVAHVSWPHSIEVAETVHAIPNFDRAALDVEVQLLLDWFWPYAMASKPSQDLQDAFTNAWHDVYPLVETSNPVWVLRDFHSPNLMVLPNKTGWRRVGLIDTQDCVLGHPAYDLVSLLQDARRDVSDETEDKLLAHYLKLRMAKEVDFDPARFKAAYSVLGAQRATKVLGIFARLAKRDGKPGYLRHIPRVSRALDKCLSHPDLTTLKMWFDTHMPAKRRVVGR